MNDYAPIDHNHDERYLKLTGGTLTGDVKFQAGLHGINPVFTGNIREGGTLLYQKYAAKSHTHEIADVSGLQATLDAMAPIVGTTAPTADTVGFVGQLYVDTATGKTYHCTARTNTGTDEEPSWSYTWEDDINANGGHMYLDRVGGDRTLKIYSTGNARRQPISIYGNRVDMTNSDVAYVNLGNAKLTGFGGADISCRNGNFTPTLQIALVNNQPSVKINDCALYAQYGFQQGISVIPDTTTACELSEGVYSHIPDSVPTYTLPAVADTGRTHEIVLNVRFGGTALSYSFEDSSGNAIAPLSTPTVEDGTVISFLCRYEPLLEQWAIMPVSLGRREVTA